jgi:hypothetical protein
MTKLMVVEPASHPFILQETSFAGYPRLGRFLHEHEVNGKSLLELQQNLPLWPGLPDRDVGIPSVEKAMTDNNKDDCVFSAEWQRFSYALILMRVQEVFPLISLQEQEDKAKKIFASGWRDKAFATNKAGSTTCYDVINGTNSDAEMMRMECVPTGGNLGMLMTVPFIYKGAMVHEVQCFDGLKPPPDPKVVNWHTTPWLVHPTATIETRIATVNGGREIRPFEFQGVKGFPCFQIVAGRDYYLFATSRIKEF